MHLEKFHRARLAVMPLLGRYAVWLFLVPIAMAQPMVFNEPFNSQDWETLTGFNNAANKATVSFPSSAEPGFPAGFMCQIDMVTQPGSNTSVVLLNKKAVYTPGKLLVQYLNVGVDFGMLGSGSTTLPPDVAGVAVRTMRDNKVWVYPGGQLVFGGSVNAWSTTTLGGIFPSALDEWSPTDGSINTASHPDLNAGPIELGFWVRRDSNPVNSSQGLNNFNVTVQQQTVPVPSCTITPRNIFLPIHFTELQASNPDEYPNSGMFVNAQNVPAGTVLSIDATTSSLATSFTSPPVSNHLNVTMNMGGFISFSISPPDPAAFDRTEVTVSGTAFGQSFACQSSATAGIGTLSQPLSRLFGAVYPAAPTGSAARQLAFLQRATQDPEWLAQARKRSRSLRRRVRAVPSSPIAKAQSGYGRTLLAFEPNRGQAPDGVLYMAHAQGMNVLLTGREAVLADRLGSAVRLRLAGSRSPARIIPSNSLPGKSNYIFGKDPARWRTNLPQYAQVAWEHVYPGIDLVFHGRQRRLELDFAIAPGARPQSIAMDIQGVRRMLIDRTGALVLSRPQGDLRLDRPAAWQEIDGERRNVSVQYVVRKGRQVAFNIGAYDRTQPLLIDPVVSYASYLGGSADDAAMAVAVDGQGSAYITGFTVSPDFPAPNAIQTTAASPANPLVFVSKLDAAGANLLYSTYIGGSEGQVAMGIAVDANGSAYVTGVTCSTDFPLMQPIQSSPGLPAPAQSPTNGMAVDAFILKLDPTGSVLVYSSYLGGSREDVGRGIAVDSAGNAYVAGYTSSDDFPLQSALQSKRGGARDAFIAKISADGTTLIYSTYLGGQATDLANAIAVDATGAAYITGITYGPFPTHNPFQKSLAGGKDAFVSKISPDGSALVYSTYLGGDSDDFGTAIAVDLNGSAYVTGVTGSSNFPTQAAIQPKFGATNLLGADAFVSKLAPDGSKLLYSTYLGGKGTDVGTSIAVAPDGSAYVAGETNSADFPSAAAIQPALAGLDNGFIVKLTPAGSALTYSTFLGGSGSDTITAIALDSTGLYVAGASLSIDFPVTPGAYQAGNQGQADALVAKIVDASQP